MSDINDRFDLLIFETAEEYLRKKRIRQLKLKKAAELERKRIEATGECEGCGCKEYVRWVHNNECYLCSDCFIHDLQCQADVMVPMHRAEDMDGYDEYLSWDELWENNE